MVPPPPPVLRRCSKQPRCRQTKPRSRHDAGQPDRQLHRNPAAVRTRHRPRATTLNLRRSPARSPARRRPRSRRRRPPRSRRRSRARQPSTSRLITLRIARRMTRRATPRKRLRRRLRKRPPRNPPRRRPRNPPRSRQTRTLAPETHPTTHRPVMPPRRMRRTTVTSRAALSAVDVVGADDDARPAPATLVTPTTTRPMVRTTTIRTQMRTTRPPADPHRGAGGAAAAVRIPHRMTNSHPTIHRTLSSKFVSHAIETRRTLADRRDWKPRSSADAKVEKPGAAGRRS